jgi:tight adherence protein C
VLIIIFLGVAAVGLGALAVSSVLEERRDARRSLQVVAAYAGPTVREAELGVSLGERVLAPVTRGLLRLGHRFTPVGYLDKVKRDIIRAGNPPGYAVDRFLVTKVLGAGSVLVWIVLFYWALGMSGLVPLVLVAALGALCFYAPDVALRRRITVEAGLGFEQALERTAAAMPGPLADEARRMLQEIRMGSSRADALRALEARTDLDDVRSFTMAMLQADNFGISVAKILKAQADETRLRRRQRAQERAQKMPVKMLFPLVFCVFPAIFVVLLLPGLLTVLDSLS